MSAPCFHIHFHYFIFCRGQVWLHSTYDSVCDTTRLGKASPPLIRQSRSVILQLHYSMFYMRLCVFGSTGQIREQPRRHGQSHLQLPEGGEQDPVQRLHAGTGLLHRLPRRESPSASLITATAGKPSGYQEHCGMTKCVNPWHLR